MKGWDLLLIYIYRNLLKNSVNVNADLSPQTMQFSENGIPVILYIFILSGFEILDNKNEGLFFRELNLGILGYT